MLLRRDTLAMTIVLGVMVAVGPVSNDMYLPSLPTIKAVFGASTAQTQLTMSAFLGGLSIGQILYGPTSDKFGRRPILMIGLAIFIVASAICAAAPSMNVLIAARVLQAIGGSAPMILARTIVRDLYQGPRAARELSFMGSVLGLSPALAPSIGSFVHETAGWRATFGVLVVLAVGLTAITFVALPETNTRPDKGPLSFRAMLQSFAIVFRHRGFRLYATALALGYAGLFSFVSAASFVLQELYGLTIPQFAFAFSACAVTLVLGSLASARLVRQFGLDRTLLIGVTCVALAGLLQVAGVLISPRGVLALMAPQALMVFGVGFILALAVAGAMSPFPERAGAASSLAGLIQMTVAAIVATVTSLALRDSALPLAIASALVGCSALLLFATGMRSKRL